MTATIDTPDLSTPLFASRSRLKLAPFAFNFTRGGTPTLAEGSIAALDWQQQLRIARLAEDSGFEAVISAARWRGYDGPSRWCQDSYDGTPWAAGIGASTSRIMVFSTVHVPLFHPVQIAKLSATVDHICGGRFAINIVSGWNVEEFQMFDYKQHEHDERYAATAEWTTLLKRLWTEHDEFDFEGKYYRSLRAYSEPKPLQRPRPPIMSAGSSPAGRQFAAAHADICFAAGFTMEQLKAAAADIKARAAQLGRTVQVWTALAMICGETEADVKRQYDYYVREKGDWKAAEDSIRLLLLGQGQTMKFEITPAMLEGRVFGSFGPQMTGTPEQLVEKMEMLADAGIDGVACIWYDYERGIERFRDLVLPVARQAGIRE